ncbi:MAG: Clp protease N-terminal domain-containing protein [Solirubrobacteraceae bacterium]
MLPVSDRARKSLLLAQEEARALCHSYIGTEHVLLGLLREEDGLAARVLASLGVTYEPVRAAVVRMLGLGVDDPGDDLPSTGPATAAIERAGREASVLGAEQLGTEHILLALMREDGGAASRILRQLDVDPVAVRSAISASES